MRSSTSTANAAVIISVAALLSFLTRTFIDYGFVYKEQNFPISSLSLLTVGNLVFVAGWMWALLAASHASRRAMYTLLVYDAFLVLFGVVTLLSLCPSPCRTAWPLGEIAIWSNLLVGIPATIAVVLSLTRKAA
jgi:hypothetical protein